MFGDVKLGVSDDATSKLFFLKALAPLLSGCWGREESTKCSVLDTTPKQIFVAFGLIIKVIFANVLVFCVFKKVQGFNERQMAKPWHGARPPHLSGRRKRDAKLATLLGLSVSNYKYFCGIAQTLLLT